MVYPGTEAYDWYRQRGLITTDDFSEWLTPSGLHNTVIRSEDVTAEELVRFCDRARREFYLRPGYLLYKLKQTLTNPSEMRRNFKSARTFGRHLFRGSDVRDQGRRSRAVPMPAPRYSVIVPAYNAGATIGPASRRSRGSPCLGRSTRCWSSTTARPTPPPRSPRAFR